MIIAPIEKALLIPGALMAGREGPSTLLEGQRAEGERPLDLSAPGIFFSGADWVMSWSFWVVWVREC